jgi:sulfatase maturation enzyme AslB (radical SAM superfamily)
MVITDSCNLNCFYCESKNSGRDNFTFDQAKDLLTNAYARGHRSLYFTGGEPLVWEEGQYKLDALVKFARELGFFDVFIFTNGTLPLNIKDCNYIVTIDGPREIHNSIRGGTYDLIIDNVRKAATNEVFASITFSKSNMQYLESYIKGISGLGIFRGISFNLLTHWPDIVKKFGLSTVERIELMDKIWQLKKDGYPIVLSRAAYLALRNNNWKRPIPQIELGMTRKIFTCCRDVDNPEICGNCGYANCVEVSQILALKPSAIWQVLKMVS